MTRWQFTITALAAALGVWLAAGIAGCDRGAAPTGGGSGSTSGNVSARGSKPVIVASIFPLADLTRRIVGDAAEVKTFMPPGANPHHFEPTPAQLVELSKADMLVGVGLHLDDWAAGPARNSGVEVALFADLVGFEAEQSGNYGQVHSHGGAVHSHSSATAGDTGHDHDHAVVEEHARNADNDRDDHAGHDDAEHDHHHHGPNPHLWLDPQQTLLFVKALGEYLAAKYPDHGETIRNNTQSLLDEIQTVDAEYRAALTRVPRRKLITFHNAFDLLAARYGLEVVAHLTPIELSPGGEVTPARLVSAVKAIKEHGLQSIYTEPQFPDQKVSTIREQTGAAILKLDPEGNPNVPGYDTWANLMRSNLKTLVQGQSTAATPE